MDYEEREDLKKKGWEIFHKSTCAGGKVQALMHYIIKSHYWRAREELENRFDCKSCLKKIMGKKYYKGYILDIDHYTPHWMFANKDHELITEDVMKSMKEWYEPRESKYMKKGCTSYFFSEED